MGGGGSVRPMAYATNADVLNRLGDALYVQLTDDAGTGSADEAKVTATREEAEAQVDSYLGRRYAVPIDTSGFEIETEMTLEALKKGMVIREVPIRYRERPEDSHSKLSPFADGFRILITILKRLNRGP